jgi:hypothetical protein
MKTIATYSFLPWLRQGVVNTIASADGDSSVKLRASIDVSLQLSGTPVGGGAPLVQPVSQTIQLYGPGDIVGIDPRAIVRTEPRNWITNFESNYLAAVDFSDPDFPWRYTPAAANGLKLRPWLTLLVLAEDEFTDGTNLANRPLPFITVPDITVFPSPDELWAWSHVHVNQSLATDPTKLVTSDMSAVLPEIQAIVSQNPDLVYSRIMCPRRLNDSTAYHAFIVPTFETGRLAGLGESPDGAPFATESAWTVYSGRPEPTNYPIYFRWFFRTGDQGDFEYLVSLLKPQPVDSRVGVRDMDVQDPGSNIPGITDPALGGVLKLGGALRVPDADLSAADLAERQKYENWDQPYPQPFQIGLANFINLADDYSVQDSATANTASGISPGIVGDPDPLITSPLYGRWHALTQRLLTNRDGTPAPNNDNWVHNLNLDPHYRVPANFGTDVVEANAEEYMNDAWEQIGDVLAANSKLRRLQLAREVSWRFHVQSLTPLAAVSSERALMTVGPVAKRVLQTGSTVSALMKTSLVPPVYTSTALRRVVRPGSRLIRILPFTSAVTPQNLMARVNAGEVTAAPPKTIPPGLPTIEQAAAAATPTNEPTWVATLLAEYPWLPYAVAIGAILLAIVVALLLPGIGLAIAALLVVIGLVLAYVLLKWETDAVAVQDLGEGGQTPASVDAMPKSPDFVLSVPGSTFTPSAGLTDSPTAVNFKTALKESFSMMVATNAVSVPLTRSALDLSSLTTTMVQAVDPLVTIPKRGLSLISIPAWIRQLIGENFSDVMAYPKIDLPMHQPLMALSSELLLPNISLIPENSITLIETNQKFIEAYMLGLNHDFARKLLWREYPTDQRGSYFRQFWDVSGYYNSANLPPDQLKEELYDIPPIHLWSPTSQLGDHNNRAPGAGPGQAQAVLVIRGELLKKYPTAVIYAHHAQWARNPDGSIDLSQPRSLQDLDDAFIDNPSPTIVRTPLYEAKVDPDIYFFGFDLTVAEAEGGPGTSPTDDPGWFFVIKQRPGEPRFGLEISRTAAPEVFEDLTWGDAVPGITPGAYLTAGALDPAALTTPPPGDANAAQNSDDGQIDSTAVSAARWAYILFRSPVMVAVHADEMLGSGS